MSIKDTRESVDRPVNLNGDDIAILLVTRDTA